MSINIRSSRELETLKRANDIVGETLVMLSKMIEPGINTKELDRAAESFIRSRGALPAFKGYQGSNPRPFPATICASINDEIVHGIPSKKRILRSGDIVSIDCGVYFNGYYGDAAVTLPVGQVDAETQRLLRVTYQALHQGISQMRQGNKLGDISSAIQTTAESAGYSVVRVFVGHGIGVNLHEEPQIPNFGKAGRGLLLKEGMVFALEPMVLMGDYEVLIDHDQWTARTKDGSLSAHFEHSVVVMKDRPSILSEAWEAIEFDFFEPQQTSRE